MFGEPPRPFIDVCLHHAGDQIFTVGLVDSGADSALFNDQFARFLGIKVEAGERGSTSGVGGRIATWTHSMTLSILGHTFAAQVDLSPEWPVEYGLLGRAGFFREFSVGFPQDSSVVLLGRRTAR